MAFVLDASVTACWAFRDEDHPGADAALDRLRHEEAFVPALWWFEIRNILVVSERRGRLSVAESGLFLRDLSRLPIRLDRAPNDTDVLGLARLHRLSVYDAAYLELARRQETPLATLDGALIRAAEIEKIRLIP